MKKCRDRTAVAQFRKRFGAGATNRWIGVCQALDQWIDGPAIAAISQRPRGSLALLRAPLPERQDKGLDDTRISARTQARHVLAVPLDASSPSYFSQLCQRVSSGAAKCGIPSPQHLHERRNRRTITQLSQSDRGLSADIAAIIEQEVNKQRTGPDVAQVGQRFQDDGNKRAVTCPIPPAQVIDERFHGPRVAQLAECLGARTSNRRLAVAQSLDERGDGAHVAQFPQRFRRGAANVGAIIPECRDQRREGTHVVQFSQRARCGTANVAARIPKRQDERLDEIRIAAVSETGKVLLVTFHPNCPLVLAQFRQRIDGCAADD
jgi:hypothetical protein